MKRMMMTTALGLLLAVPATAQTADTATTAMDAEMFMGTPADGDMYGTDLIGKRLYVSEAEFEDGFMSNPEMRADWDDVGEIGDLLISQDGEIDAVLLDIGGFLGMGERTVAVNMDELHFIHDDGSMDDVFIAISGSRGMLENAPEFERPSAMMDGAATPEAPAAEMAATEQAPMADPAAPSEEMAMGTRPAMTVDGYKDMAPEALTAEALDGANVYSVTDEDIGNVSELVLDDSGQITDAIVDVGGFLGMGAKAVALTMDEIQIVRSDAGDDVRVYVDTTKEALEARPEYVE